MSYKWMYEKRWLCKLNDEVGVVFWTKRGAIKFGNKVVSDPSVPFCEYTITKNERKRVMTLRDWLSEDHAREAAEINIRVFGYSDLNPTLSDFSINSFTKIGLDEYKDILDAKVAFALRLLDQPGKYDVTIKGVTQDKLLDMCLAYAGATISEAEWQRRFKLTLYDGTQA